MGFRVNGFGREDLWVNGFTLTGSGSYEPDKDTAAAAAVAAAAARAGRAATAAAPDRPAAAPDRPAAAPVPVEDRTERERGK